MYLHDASNACRSIWKSPNHCCVYKKDTSADTHERILINSYLYCMLMYVRIHVCMLINV